MKVFVIEDNPVYNDYVCNLLKKDSFDTMSAYNLATAKKLLAKSEVDDIVVADLRLPDGESIELLRWMRANDKQQVFIVMTNYGEVHTAVESMKLGSKDYIQKQLLEDKLIPLIRTLQKEHEKRLQWNIPIFVRQGEAYQKIKKRVRLVATTRMSGEGIGTNPINGALTLCDIVVIFPSCCIGLLISNSNTRAVLPSSSKAIFW
jgi:two-component system, NtrC family, response regulator HydG